MLCKYDTVQSVRTKLMTRFLIIIHLQRLGSGERSKKITLGFLVQLLTEMSDAVKGHRKLAELLNVGETVKNSTRKPS